LTALLVASIADDDFAVVLVTTADSDNVDASDLTAILIDASAPLNASAAVSAFETERDTAPDDASDADSDFASLFASTPVAVRFADFARLTDLLNTAVGDSEPESSLIATLMFAIVADVVSAPDTFFETDLISAPELVSAPVSVFDVDRTIAPLLVSVADFASCTSLTTAPDVVSVDDSDFAICFTSAPELVSDPESDFPIVRNIDSTPLNVSAPVNDLLD
jgi:hypothetical protein